MLFSTDPASHPYRIEILQAGAQVAAISVSVSIAIFSGAITGLILNFPVWDNLVSNEFYEDDAFWEVSKKQIQKRLLKL